MKARRLLAQVGLSGFFLIFGFIGCGTHPALEGPGNSSADSQTAAAASDGASFPADPRLQQTFSEATRQEPPSDWQRPPDMTLTGKSVGKLYTQVANIWDTIR